MTLIELAITGALLCLLLTLVSGVVVSYARAYRQREDQENTWQRATHSLEALSRDLRSAVEVLSPPRQPLLQGMSPMGWQTPEALAVTVRTAQGVRVRAWGWDPAAQQLVCQEFASLEDWRAGKLAEQFTLGRFPLWVQYRRINAAPLLLVRLQGLEPRLPLETQLAFPAFATSPWAAPSP